MWSYWCLSRTSITGTGREQIRGDIQKKTKKAIKDYYNNTDEQKIGIKLTKVTAVKRHYKGKVHRTDN